MKRRGFLSGLGGLLGAVGLGVKPDVPEPKPPKPDEHLVTVAVMFEGRESVVETIELPNGWVRISQTT